MNVAIYARVSTDKQTKSVGQQLEQCRELAQRQGYTVVAEFSDDGISGDKVEERPQFMQLLADAKAKKFKRVLAWDADRLGRTDSMTAAEMLNPLRKVGIKFELVKQGEVDLITLKAECYLPSCRSNATRCCLIHRRQSFAGSHTKQKLHRVSMVGRYPLATWGTLS